MNRERKTINSEPLFPPASDRTAWETVLRIPRNRRIGNELVRRARALLREPVPELPATLFMDYVRNGNRSRYERVYFARRTNFNTLVLAEVIEYRGRFLDKIIDYLWEITAEHTWSLPAHCGMNEKTDPLPEPPAICPCARRESWHKRSPQVHRGSCRGASSQAAAGCPRCRPAGEAPPRQARASG